MAGELESIVELLAGGIATPEIDRRWCEQLLSSTDPEVQGALFVLLVERCAVVQPPMEPTLYDRFVASYLRRCMESDVGRSEWVLTPYLAGHTLAGWIARIDLKTGNSRVQWWVEWMANFYRSATADTRDVIVNGALEHLFEHRGVRRMFHDWRRDPVLNEAWRAAEEWVAKSPKAAT